MNEAGYRSPETGWGLGWAGAACLALVDQSHPHPLKGGGGVELNEPRFKVILAEAPSNGSTCAAIVSLIHRAITDVPSSSGCTPSLDISVALVFTLAGSPDT